MQPVLCSDNHMKPTCIAGAQLTISVTLYVYTVTYAYRYHLFIVLTSYAAN